MMASDWTIPKPPSDVEKLVQALNEIRNAIMEVTEELRKLNNGK